MKPALLVATKGWDVERWASRVRPLLPEHPYTRALLAAAVDLEVLAA